MKASKNKFLIDLVTLMPEMFEAFTNFGVVGKGFKKNFVGINFLNPRNFATESMHTTTTNISDLAKTYSHHGFGDSILISEKCNYDTLSSNVRAIPKLRCT